MPNVLDSTGLTTSTRQELVDYFTSKYQEIYGADINLESDTPDGQMMNINIQSILDIQDLLTQVYNNQSPDSAIGNVLDQRVAINGIQRQAGTFTVTNVTVVTTQSVNLYGSDQSDQPIYTVSDSAGNLWELQTTVLGTGVGSFVYAFQAAVPGAQLTIPNTITIQVTIVLGVASVNNPTTYTTLGINEESDAALRIRRQRSVSLASQGYLAGLRAALLNIEGMASAFVYENNTDTTDGDGVPSHSIWVITSGTATDEDIAQAIYDKRNAGCGMFGDEEYEIEQVDGTFFTIRWDEVVAVNLFIFFTATSINGTTEPDVNAIRTGLVSSFIPDVFQEVDINGLATQVQIIDSNTLVTNAGFSDGTDQVFTLSGVAASGVFKINYNGNQSADINWNDAVGDIQTKVQAIAGLSTATVTGSIASQTLTFDLSTIENVQGLLYVTNNTLATVAPAAITFSYDYNPTDTLTPASKNFQFVVSADNIVIVPMIMSQTSLTAVRTTGEVTFTAFGGYGDYIYSIQTNNSGATIDANTGEYTAGSTPNVTDTIKATDALGNTKTGTVAVT